MKFQNKVVIVTGSSSGIGAATAIRFAKEGAKVVINYLSNKDQAEKVQKEILELGGIAIIFQADVSKEDQAKALIETTINEFGDLDILVNNAGKYVSGDEWNDSSDAWKETLDINLISTLNCSKYAGEYFLKSKKGVIVNIASRFGVIGDQYGIAYGAAKAGVINITKAYAKLLAPVGRANSVAPGATKAGYWETAPQKELDEVKQGILLNDLAETKDISDSILFLASDESRMITGQNLIVDGGYTLR